MNLKLEMRACKCGCRRAWRCLPESKSEYFSLACRFQTYRARMVGWFDQKEREKVARIQKLRTTMAMHKDGAHPRDIAARLNELGLRTRTNTRFTENHVRVMLYNLGFRRRKKT